MQLCQILFKLTREREDAPVESKPGARGQKIVNSVRIGVQWAPSGHKRSKIDRQSTLSWLAFFFLQFYFLN